jgi:hypothetical protein
MNAIKFLSPILLDYFLDMKHAPKGGGAESVSDPAWVNPPILLMLFEAGDMCVVSWDWCYAEGGMCFYDGVAWIELVSGEQANKYYGEPVGWLPLPDIHAPDIKGMLP